LLPSYICDYDMTLYDMSAQNEGNHSTLNIGQNVTVSMHDIIQLLNT